MWKLYEMDNDVPKDKPFPAIDDYGKFCFVQRIGDEEIGGSHWNWRYYYRPGIERESGKLKIQAWFDLPYPEIILASKFLKILERTINLIPTGNERDELCDINIEMRSLFPGFKIR